MVFRSGKTSRNVRNFRGFQDSIRQLADPQCPIPRRLAIRQSVIPTLEFAIFRVFCQKSVERNPHTPMQWYYSKNSTQLGPVSYAELRAKISSGEILPTDMVWREGMTDWVTVSNALELAFPAPGIPQQPTLHQMPETEQASPYATPKAPTATYSPIIAPRRTSGLAITSLVCGVTGLFCLMLPGIPAVICGHMALNQIKNSAEAYEGRGMAIAGLILGYICIAFLLIYASLFLIGIVAGAVH